MRSLWGRIGHSLAFELVLLLVCTPILALIFNKSLAHTGALSISLSLMAMVGNGVYNYIFDRILLALDRPLYPRSFKLRCIHSVCFELFLMIFTLPLVMWWMTLSFLKALAVDLGFAMFVPLYALVFNWVYDRLVPAPAAKAAAQAK